MKAPDAPILTIMVPIDGSDGSGKALLRAASLAEALDAELLLLEVIEDFGPLPGKYDAPPEGVDRTEWLAGARMGDARAILEDRPLRWRSRVEEGYPAEVICEIAEQESVDLIVLGSRGLGPIGRFLLGSVSDKVARHAPCSVMLVR